jgi:glutathione S-transferase
VFIPLLDPKAPTEVKVYAHGKVALRLGILQDHLAHNEFLLDRFSVADAYLTAVLNWAAFSVVDLAAWPAVSSYYQRQVQRASIARALGKEWAMYQEGKAQPAKV